MERPSEHESVTLAIKGFAVAIIAICIIGYAVSALRESTIETKSGTVHPYGTLNPAFADNDTDNTPTHWDNYIENGAVNAWGSGGGYITVTSTDNETAKTDNGVWYQSLTLSTAETYDGVDSALANFSYRIIDNDNAFSIVIRVLLGRTSDNITLFSENLTKSKSATWITVENDVSAYITGAGTYTLYLRAEMCGHGGPNPVIGVGFDNAGLTVNTYERSVGEEIAVGSGSMTVKVFTLLFAFVVIGVALYLLRRFEAI